MKKVKIPSLDTAITVLCDLTHEQILTEQFVIDAISGRKSADKVVIVTRPNYGAAHIQREMYRILAEANLAAVAGKKSVLILTNNLQISSLAAVLMNSKAEKKLRGIPEVRVDSVRAWEVWDDANVLVSDSDGMVTSTSFDEAFRPIVSDIMRLQKLNAPDKEGEDTGDVEVFDEDTPPAPRVIEKAVVDEGMIANSPKDIIRRRIDAAEKQKNEEFTDK